MAILQGFKPGVCSIGYLSYIGGDNERKKKEMTQWIAAGIFGAIIVACFILLFAIGLIEVELEFGQEFFKGLIHN